MSTMMAAPWADLFRQLEHAHTDLARQFDTGISIVDGLRQVRAALQAETIRIGADLWEREPEPGEWSMRQMLEHVVAHDHKWDEVRSKGVAHYVDHGRLHMEQAAKIRQTVREGR